ncbi:MAG: hypothetical protein H6657_19270 [Ardenticatenaceae bacterium]|nr:hypothetical protein [Ardenticatenaceae bacterium]
MKRKSFSLVVDVIGIVLLLFAASCAVASTEPVPSREQESLTTSVIASPIPLTPTNLVANLTSSIEPTLTLAPTNTPTLTPTIESIVTEIPTAIPTPPGDDTNSQVLWLLETNNGCQLPCWWGITPGQTDWPTAQNFLSIFDSNIYEASVTSELIYYGIRIPLLPEIFQADQTELGILAHEGFVEKIFTDVSFGNTPTGYLASYTLPTFLTNYGQPSEVWMFTYRSALEGNELPFAIVLFYAEKGIAGLFSDNGERQGDIVQGCPQEDVVSFLSLWAPSLNLTFAQVINGTSALEKDYLALEDATEMDIETFYETFVNPENTICLQTPANLWH